MTFVQNHAQGIVACDFLVALTARFQVLFVFVAMEIGSRRILHSNVTAHPTAEWTLQQLREAIPSDHPYRFLIHKRDSIFSSELDQELKLTFGLTVLRAPVRAPQANAHCERLIGTVRRECLDFLIPLNQRHLRGALGYFELQKREKQRRKQGLPSLIGVLRGYPAPTSEQSNRMLSSPLSPVPALFQSRHRSESASETLQQNKSMPKTRTRRRSRRAS